MSHLDFRSGVYYPRRGILELVSSMERLGKSLGVAHHYNSSVKRILLDGHQATGVDLIIMRGEVVIGHRCCVLQYLGV